MYKLLIGVCNKLEVPWCVQTLPSDRRLLGQTFGKQWPERVFPTIHCLNVYSLQYTLPGCVFPTIDCLDVYSLQYNAIVAIVGDCQVDTVILRCEYCTQIVGSSIFEIFVTGKQHMQIYIYLI